MWYHALFDPLTSKLYTDSCCSYLNHYITNASTPFEIAKLTDALLKEGKAWNPETKKIEDIQIPVLNFKDWCLARSDKSRPWTPVQFAFVFTDGDGRKYLMSCGGISWRDWLPMEGNEHLMGKTGE